MDNVHFLPIYCVIIDSIFYDILIYMWNPFRRNKSEQQNTDDPEVEVEITDSVGNRIGTEKMKRSEADAQGFLYEAQSQDGPTSQSETGDNRLDSWWSRKKTAPASEHASEMPEDERARLAESASYTISDTALGEVASMQNLPIEARLEASRDEVKDELAGEVQKRKFFGQKSVDALVGFAAGTGAAITYKTVAGWGLRTAVKRGFDLTMPGTGAVVGAAVSGSYELIKHTIAEKKRVYKEREDFEQEVGLERLRAVLEMRAGGKQFGLESSPEAAEIYERYAQIKVDKKKIATAVVRGALIGGIGGYAGGYLAEKFLGGAVSAVEKGVEKISGVTMQMPGFGTPDGGRLASVFEGKTVSVNSEATTENVRHMGSNVWSTVKEYLKEHGIEKPSNKLINEATRIVAEENGVQITSDAKSAAHAIKDIAMAKGFELHGFEKLSDLIEEAGGSVESVSRDVLLQAPENLPKAGYFPEVLMSEVSNVSEKTLWTAGFLASGTVVGGALARYLKNRKKSKQTASEESVFAEESHEDAAVHNVPEAASENIFGEDIHEREVQEGYAQFLDDAETIGAHIEELVAGGYLEEAKNDYNFAIEKLNTLKDSGLTGTNFTRLHAIVEKYKVVGNVILKLQEERDQLAAQPHEQAEAREQREKEEFEKRVIDRLVLELNDATNENILTAYRNLTEFISPDISPEVYESTRVDVEYAVKNAQRHLIDTHLSEIQRLKKDIEDGTVLFTAPSFLEAIEGDIASQSELINPGVRGFSRLSTEIANVKTLIRDRDKNYRDQEQRGAQKVREERARREVGKEYDDGLKLKIDSLENSQTSHDIMHAYSELMGYLKSGVSEHEDTNNILVKNSVAGAKERVQRMQKNQLRSIDNLIFVEAYDEAEKNIKAMKEEMEAVMPLIASSASPDDTQIPESLDHLEKLLRASRESKKEVTKDSGANDSRDDLPLPPIKKTGDTKEVSRERLRAVLGQKFLAVEAFLDRIDTSPAARTNVVIYAFNLSSISKDAEVIRSLYPEFAARRDSLVKQILSKGREDVARKVWEKMAPGLDFPVQQAKKKSSTRVKKETGGTVAPEVVTELPEETEPEITTPEATVSEPVGSVSEGGAETEQETSSEENGAQKETHSKSETRVVLENTKLFNSILSEQGLDDSEVESVKENLESFLNSNNTEYLHAAYKVIRKKNKGSGIKVLKRDIKKILEGVEE